MSDIIGFINPSVAPVLTRIAKEERPAWDQSRKKQDTGQDKVNAEPAQATNAEDEDSAEKAASTTHIDLRI
ncbi:MAG: hypothetical protein HXY20_07410 [Acidobacteria bacterium]|nr:hypothetical protein [Acidobacteriota bacterium]